VTKFFVNRGEKNANRRRSDRLGFFEDIADVNQYVEAIFCEVKGEVELHIGGVGRRRVLYTDESDEKKVAFLACQLALAVSKEIHLRESMRSIALAACLHDIGKHHEDIQPLIRTLSKDNLRDGNQRRKKRLRLIREGHTRKGPVMLKALEVSYPWLSEHQPFLDDVASYHGQDYAVNVRRRIWSALEINIITIADEFDAMISPSPHRLYRERLTTQQAADQLAQHATAGRYEKRIAEIFIEQNLVLGV
jgi:hypothetical protein